MMDTYQAAIGTYSVRESRELYAIRIEDGKMSVTDTAPSHDVGYLAAHPTDPVVYATRENMIFRGRANGGVGAYSLNKDGRLRLLNEAACAGQMPCHISVSTDGRKAYVSSFISGLTSVAAIGASGRIGEPERILTQPERDGIAPSVHCSVETPDGKYLAAVNVTQHRVVLYDLADDLREAFCLVLPEPFNYRPRHIAFGNGHAYLVTETGHTMMVLRYRPEEDEILALADVRPLLPAYFSGKARGSAVRVTPDGKLLIASVRYADMLTVFPLSEDGTPKEGVFIPTVGKSPRDFAISPDGKYLLAGMQNSDSVSLYRIDTEAAELRFVSALEGIPCSTAVAFVQ